MVRTEANSQSMDKAPATPNALDIPDRRLRRLTHYALTDSPVPPRRGSRVETKPLAGLRTKSR